MTGVTWRELPAEAPEPPPLSVVRDRVNRWWVGDYATYEGARHWLLVGDDIVTTWAALTKEDAPLRLGQPEGVLRRRVESVEPSPYEVRRAALDAVARMLLPADYADGIDEAVARTAGRMLAVAREFEAYLRGDDGDPYAPPAAPLGTYGWRRDRDGRIRHAYMDGGADVHTPDSAEVLARKYAEAPGYSLVIFGGDAGTWVPAT